MALFLLSSNVFAQSIDKYFKYIEKEVTLVEIEEIIGPDFTTSSDSMTYTKAGVSVRLDRYAYNRPNKKMVIREVAIMEYLLASKENKENPFLGLTTKTNKEECLEILGKNPHVKNLKFDTDLYGEGIKFHYLIDSKSPIYTSNFVFIRLKQGKKRKTYPRAITIYKYKKIR